VRHHLRKGAPLKLRYWAVLAGLLAACSSTPTPVQSAPTAPTTVAPTTTTVPSPHPTACHARADRGGLITRTNVLPDPHCTPGAVDPRVTQADIGSTICVAGYTTTVRPPTSYTEPLKLRLLTSYGYTTGRPSAFELDHRVPLEVGGDPRAVANLWPEIGGVPNPKDSIEGYVHRLVCAGRITLTEGEAVFEGDYWAWAAQNMPPLG
jgi:hypothetical protein